MKQARFSILSLALIITLVIVGCMAPTAPAPAAQDAAGAQADVASSDEQIELRIAWWGSQDRHDRTIKVIELFESMYPNIDIVYEFSGWDDHWTKMATQAAGSNLPDIMQHDYARLEEWVARGLIAPLDDFVADGVIDLSNTTATAIDGGRIGGKLYAINLGTNSQVIVIDEDAFAQAGLELPDQDWTWEEFEQIALTLQEELGIWGIGPWLIAFFAFTFVPIVASLILAFTDYNVLGSVTWVELENFQRMFTGDPRYLKAIKATFYYVLTAVPLRLIFALTIAMVLNTKRNMLGVYRAAFYAPSIVGGSVAVAVMWRKIFGSEGLADAHYLL